MNGAESVIRTLADAGVRVCFANPGTSEMHLVDAIDRVDGMRVVLGLFEGVVTGAADGYARMTGEPAATLLHLGPGLGNGLANLHNARKAQVPMVNLVGDHATAHQRFEAPLTADVQAFAATVSHWVEEPVLSSEVGAATARAVEAARSAPGRIATLVLPADTAWGDGGVPAVAGAGTPPAAVRGAVLDAARAALRRGGPVALLLRGPALRGEALVAAGRIAAATGARLFCDTFAPRLERGAGRVPVERMPYRAADATAALAGLQTLIVVGTQAPVAFFSYPGQPSELTPEGTEVLVLATEQEDGAAALLELASAVAPDAVPRLSPAQLPTAPADGPLTADAAMRILARRLPEGAIVSDEGLTSAYSGYAHLAGAAPHDVLFLTGGAIGDGMPLAVGAAVACPDRRVVTLEGDGSAMYTLQALWTQARERLDVVTVVFVNRAYAVLEEELAWVGGGTAGPKARSTLELGDPDIDYSSLARGLGVSAVRADTVADFDRALAEALETPGPVVLEAVVYHD
ncbi:acetolactate synthase large subunit [Herbiconiux moechotypicola]|uniref:Acetolactate synthase large subunit n=1 Tax=Herbiconiux moechotypicola TaxID=637393 RepID=A0ABN3E2W6_9MICO|nr:acetolactate synthase large subunit [Herbiconiux moechotypicola]MCS5731319.1 acetolactate synthase large subunit [Herbiconiux moechotypicola]